MLVSLTHADVEVDGSPMRIDVAAPTVPGRFPGLVFFADIFGNGTDPTQRAMRRFAGHGFVVAAPQFYHRHQPPDRFFAFEDRDGAMNAAAATTAADFDADTLATIAYLKTRADVRHGALGATGFCIGGHLAVRAALQPEIKATAAFYPTGLPQRSLGGSTDVDTLTRVPGGGIAGATFIALGLHDNHVEKDAIAAIYTGFALSPSPFFVSMYDGGHAFMRDNDEPRYNPSEADRAYHDAIAFLRDRLAPLD
jgi:carboxymethylenebutenolidase